MIEGNGIGREEIVLDRRKWDWMGGTKIGWDEINGIAKCSMITRDNSLL